jgi:hypothetical protein
MVTKPMRDRCARALAGRARDLAIGEKNVLAAVLTAAESGAPIAKRVLDHALACSEGSRLERFERSRVCPFASTNVRPFAAL